MTTISFPLDVGAVVMDALEEGVAGVMVVVGEAEGRITKKETRDNVLMTGADSKAAVTLTTTTMNLGAMMRATMTTTGAVADIVVVGAEDHVAEAVEVAAGADTREKVAKKKAARKHLRVVREQKAKQLRLLQAILLQLLPHRLAVDTEDAEGDAEGVGVVPIERRLRQ